MLISSASYGLVSSNRKYLENAACSAGAKALHFPYIYVLRKFAFKNCFQKTLFEATQSSTTECTISSRGTRRFHVQHCCCSLRLPPCPHRQRVPVHPRHFQHPPYCSVFLLPPTY